MIVVVSHYVNQSQLFPGYTDRGFGLGQTGVMMFFTLSGFLMAYLYLDAPPNRETMMQYLRRRLARVYPLFAAVAAVPLALNLLGVHGDYPFQEISTPAAYLRQILLIDKGVNLFWTVRVEIIFYLLFIPIWLLKHRLRNDSRFLVLLVAAILLLRFFREELDFEVGNHIHFFLLGLVSARLFHLRQPYSGLSFSALAVILLVSLLFSFPDAYLILFGLTLHPWRNDLLFLQVALAFNLVLRERRWLYQALSSKFGRWLGRVSYSTYLLHMFVIWGAWTLWGQVLHKLPLLGIVVLLVLLLSLVSYNLFEMPMQRAALRSFKRQA